MSNYKSNFLSNFFHKKVVLHTPKEIRKANTLTTNNSRQSKATERTNTF